jgi:hypothetical protein
MATKRQAGKAGAMVRKGLGKRTAAKIAGIRKSKRGKGSK